MTKLYFSFYSTSDLIQNFPLESLRTYTCAAVLLNKLKNRLLQVRNAIHYLDCITKTRIIPILVEVTILIYTVKIMMYVQIRCCILNKCIMWSKFVWNVYNNLYNEDCLPGRFIISNNNRPRFQIFTEIHEKKKIFTFFLRLACPWNYIKRPV